MMKFLAVPFALLMASTAFAQDTPAPAASGAPAKPVKEKKICRSGDVPLGSFVPVRVCHTKDEWTEIDRQNAQQADTMLGRHSGASNHN